MLIEFTVGNYLSFKDKKTLSLEAAPIKEFPGNVIEAGKYNLLRSCVLYGANSSGKSNLLKALSKMQEIVVNSASESSIAEIDVTPFLLSTESENQPSYFEILFLLKDIRYRYGFEVDKKKVHAEWLFKKENGKEKELFLRNNDAIEVTKEFIEGKGLEDKTRKNAFFLSVADQFNGAISGIIMHWFGVQRVLSTLQHEKGRLLTSSFLVDMKRSIMVKNFLNSLNLGFYNIALTEDKAQNDIVTFHNKYNNKVNVIDKCEFQLLGQESSGTNKLYDLTGFLFLGLEGGALIIIDELDAKLHPLLTLAIVKLFNSPDHNKKNAQLVFATHDTNLLNYGNFRRDQVYFTEKDRFEATDLYSLVEYKEPDGTKVRNDRSFEKDYIAGRYGAIPYIGDFSKLFNDGKKSKN